MAEHGMVTQCLPPGINTTVRRLAGEAEKDVVSGLPLPSVVGRCWGA